ncbi:invasion associated locus B family protein [Microvirga arabica]|uniref:Invasion associated locus B family protein n=1 Tax=Microvirga arabica TaxID=1128671 RepID=A0ABV6Y477_9HYPH
MPFTSRLAGSVAALVLALSSSPSLSQGAGQGSKPKQSALQSQQAQSPNGGPVIVQLKPEPAQPDWTKVCEKNEGSKTEICYTTRDFITDKGQRVFAVAVYDVKGKKAQRTLRLLTPLGSLVPPGVRITLDKGRTVGGRYTSCLPHGCFAEASVKDSFAAALKKGTTLNVSARNQAGSVVTFAVPTDGFGKAFDGPPLDPQVLVEQQRKMQEELQKQAEELRGRLQSNTRNGTQSSAAGQAQTND